MTKVQTAAKAEHTKGPKQKKPWKPSPMQRTCKFENCPDKYAPGQIPQFWNGERAYWHLKCLLRARALLARLEK